MQERLRSWGVGAAIFVSVGVGLALLGVGIGYARGNRGAEAATFASAGVTAILVGITVHYAWSTAQLARLTQRQADIAQRGVDVAERAVEQADHDFRHRFRPYVIIAAGPTDLCTHHSDRRDITVAVINIGAGGATQVDLDFRWAGYRWSGRFHGIAPGETRAGVGAQDRGADPDAHANLPDTLVITITARSPLPGEPAVWQERWTRAELDQRGVVIDRTLSPDYIL